MRSGAIKEYRRSQIIRGMFWLVESWLFGQVIDFTRYKVNYSLVGLQPRMLQ